MAAVFTRTLRSLQSDRVPWGMAGLVSLLILPAAVAWMVLAEVTVYEVSSAGRLEVKAAPSSIAASVEGRVVSSKLHVGLEAAAGDELVVLDGEAVRRAIDERRAHSLALCSRRTALLSEVQAQERTIADQAKARELAVKESQAQFVAAQARARFAQQTLERALSLISRQVVSEEELAKARSEAEVAQATVQAAQLTMTRGEQDRRVEEGERQVELAALRRQAVELDGELAIEQAAIRRLEYDLDLRTVRAPISGRVEEVVPFRVGSVVRPAEKLGTLVPPGEPRVVAQFPVAAVGRIRAGQTARLRLDGFPWTQYGTLAATVTGVGNEAADGLIRVELRVEPPPTSRIPLQHGQTGAVEVAVEQASPAVLVLRAAGQYLTAHRPGNRVD